jgi:uncharacterized glyoxalase superfamily protein PhnB
MTDITETQPAAAEVKDGVIAYLQLDGAMKAAKFYQRALCDGSPESGHPTQKPQGFHLMLDVDDIDAWWQRAVDTGAEVVVPVAEMFWGARYGQLRDPFGVVWALNQRLGS